MENEGQGRSNFLSLHDIYMARLRIAPLITRTPLVDSPRISALSAARVFMKLENFQVTGSFKLRGAANKIINLSEPARQRGIITVSSGNHGRAVAYVSKSLGVKASICIPEPVPSNKRRAIQDLGGQLLVHGENADQAMLYADQIQAERGLTMVHPFDDLEIIAGQGTLALEVFEELPELDTIIVPLSGGGLISGIAFVVKSISPTTRVVGVSMQHGAAMVESLKAGKVVDIIETPTLADALAGGLNKDNQYTFSMVQQYVDETVLVSEDEIAQAMRFCLEEHQMLVEGGGAVGIAAILANKVYNLGQNIAIVVSGGNVSVPTLVKILSSG